MKLARISYADFGSSSERFTVEVDTIEVQKSIQRHCICCGNRLTSVTLLDGVLRTSPASYVWSSSDTGEVVRQADVAQRDALTLAQLEWEQRR